MAPSKDDKRSKTSSKQAGTSGHEWQGLLLDNELSFKLVLPRGTKPIIFKHELSFKLVQADGAPPLLMDNEFSFKLVRPKGTRTLLLDNDLSFKLVVPDASKALFMDNSCSFKLVRPAGARPLLLDNSCSFQLVFPRGSEPLREFAEDVRFVIERPEGGGEHVLDHELYLKFKKPEGQSLLDNESSFQLVHAHDGSLLRMQHDDAELPHEITHEDNEQLLQACQQARAKGYRELANRIKWKLVLVNDRLVAHAAGKMYEKYRCQEQGLEQGDLISAGNRGMLYAVEKYDFERGARFSTYAYRQIASYIYHFIYADRQTIPIPPAQQKKIKSIREAEVQLSAAGNEPASEAVAEMLGLSERDVRDLQAAPLADRSLDEISRDGGKPRELHNFVPDDRLPQPDVQIDEQLQAAELHCFMRAVLNEQEFLVIRRRYGLGDSGDEPETLQQIGNALRLSRERIRQIEEKAMDKLRAAVTDKPRGKKDGISVLKSISRFFRSASLLDNDLSFRMVRSDDDETLLMENDKSFKVVPSAAARMRELRQQFTAGLADRHRADEMRGRLDGLPDQERTVLELRYGLRDGKPLTLKQISAMFNIKVLQVWRLEKRALKKVVGGDA